MTDTTDNQLFCFILYFYAAKINDNLNSKKILSYAVCRELKQEVKEGRLGSRKISTIKPGLDYFFQK